LQANDDAESWAALGHDLRWAAPHFGHATTLPWPLHLAQLIGEYIVPVQMIEEIEAAGRRRSGRVSAGRHSAAGSTTCGTPPYRYG
jgi:hypothetical protein